MIRCGADRLVARITEVHSRPEKGLFWMNPIEGPSVGGEPGGSFQIMEHLGLRGQINL